MLELSQTDIVAFSTDFLSMIPPAAIKRMVKEGEGVNYTEYQADPVGYARDVLGITVTDDIATMLESVRDNRITIARSCTGSGKSHGGKVAGYWFYNSFPDSRVYTIANPFENQKIL